MTMTSPPMTDIGMDSARGPNNTTSSASHAPAKMPVHRVWAPALVATPVRDSEPPTGSAWKKPPARLATPWARKSPEALWRLPSGFGTAAEMPAACARATSDTAIAPTTSFGATVTSGNTGAGRLRGMVAMSPTFSTLTPVSATPRQRWKRSAPLPYAKFGWLTLWLTKCIGRNQGSR